VAIQGLSNLSGRSAGSRSVLFEFTRELRGDSIHSFRILHKLLNQEGYQSREAHESNHQHHEMDQVGRVCPDFPPDVKSMRKKCSHLSRRVSLAPLRRNFKNKKTNSAAPQIA